MLPTNPTREQVATELKHLKNTWCQDHFPKTLHLPPDFPDDKPLVLKELGVDVEIVLDMDCEEAWLS